MIKKFKEFIDEGLLRHYNRWHSGDKRKENKIDKSVVVNFLNDNKIPEHIVTINDYSVDFNGDVNIYDMDDKLPFKIGKVDGDFNISENDIETLENCPDFITGNFDLSSNYIKNFKGFPNEVGGNVYAVNCMELESLEGLRGVIGGSLIITTPERDEPFTEDDLPKDITVKGRIKIKKKLTTRLRKN